MKNEGRYPVMVGIKLPADIAEEIRRQASEDDRTVGGYLRRIIVAIVRQRTNEQQSDSR